VFSSEVNSLDALHDRGLRQIKVGLRRCTLQRNSWHKWHAIRPVTYAVRQPLPCILPTTVCV